MKHVRYCSLGFGSPEPALAAVDRRSARRPRRTALPPARRSTRRSTTRPTSSPRSRLDNRASDINNLLDGIGNGVQVLQAANTGITSLQKLVDTAKSIANQVLQSCGRLFDQVDHHRRRRHRRHGASRRATCAQAAATSACSFAATIRYAGPAFAAPCPAARPGPRLTGQTAFGVGRRVVSQLLAGPRNGPGGSPAPPRVLRLRQRTRGDTAPRPASRRLMMRPLEDEVASV